MAGRPDFSQAGSQGSGQTVAVSNRPEIQTSEATLTTTVSSGQSETTEIYAPTGSVYNARSMYLYAPAPGSATSGNHTFRAKSANFVSVLKGRSSYGTRIIFNNSMWTDADSYGYPNDGAATAVQSLRATENTPVSVKYSNDTDVSNSNERRVWFVFEEVEY